MKKYCYLLFSLVLLWFALLTGYDRYEQKSYQDVLYQPEVKDIYLPCFAHAELCHRDDVSALINYSRYSHHLTNASPAYYHKDLAQDKSSQHFSGSTKIMNFSKGTYTSSFLLQSDQEYLLDVENDVFSSDQTPQFVLYNLSEAALQMCLDGVVVRSYRPDLSLPMSIANAHCHTIFPHKYLAFNIDNPKAKTLLSRYRMRLLATGADQQVVVAFRGI